MYTYYLCCRAKNKSRAARSHRFLHALRRRLRYHLLASGESSAEVKNGNRNRTDYCRELFA